MKTKLLTLFLAIMATNSLWAKFQCGNLYYETLSSNTAEVVGYLGEPTSVNVSSIVQFNSKRYTVISIGSTAFQNYSSLTSVTIPNSVTSIGSSSFQECTSLNNVVCKAVLVPTTDRNVFSDVPISSAVLYVPDESVEIYKYMEPWSKFSMILPISKLPSGVEDLQISTNTDASPQKIIRDGQVLILQNNKSYNVMGQEIE